MSLRKVDEKYLESLGKREEQLDEQIRDREQKQKEVNRMFLEHVRKELDLLMGEKEKMTQRNELYLSEIKNYSKEFNRILPELMEAE
jgi:hypothetical protein